MDIRKLSRHWYLPNCLPSGGKYNTILIFCSPFYGSFVSLQLYKLAAKNDKLPLTLMNRFESP